MKLVGKVHVEPLAEERLTNIERNLVVRVSEMSQRPVRAPSRMLAFAGVAVAVLAAGFVGWKLRGPGAPSVAAPAHEVLALDNHVLDLGDAQIASSASTKAQIERTGGRIVVTMKVGKLDLHVEHKVGRLFVVKAGDVEIEDVGTRFSVDYDGTNVDVRVTEGEVKVKSKGQEIAIRASEAWTLELGKITIVALEQRAAAAAQNVVASNVATPSTPAKEDVVAVAATGSDSGGAGSGSAARGSAGSASAGSGSAVRGAGDAKKTDMTFRNARRAIEKHKYMDPVDIGVTNPTDYFERASKLGEGEEKGMLLYSAAVLQHRAKNDEAALRTLSALARPDRSGQAYQPSLWLRLRIQCLEAFDDKCREVAELFQRKFTSGVQSGIAKEVLGVISRAQ